MVTRILVVDDEPQITRSLGVSLRAYGYDVDIADNGARALLLASANHPDAVVLDLGLPDIDGMDVLRRLRERSRVPVVILSVRDAEEQIVQALDAGADDYITKPFSMPTLLARLRAAIRRHEPPPDDPVVTTADFTLDLLAMHATRGGEDVHLTPREWALVAFLARNPERLVTHRELLEHVWGPSSPYEPAYLRVHMGHVRRKLEPTPSRPRYFVTEAGMGYRFHP